MSEKKLDSNNELKFIRSKITRNIIIQVDGKLQKTILEIIEDRLKKEYSENTQNGVIPYSSILNIEFSNGTMVSESITEPDFNFVVSYDCNILLPKKGNVVYNCIVKGKNTGFLTAEKIIDEKYKLVLHIQKQRNNEEDPKMNSINIGDCIDVEIIISSIKNNGENNGDITTMAKIYNGGKSKKSVSFNNDLVKEILSNKKDSDDLYENVDNISTDTESISNIASDQAEQDKQDDTDISLQTDDVNVGNDE